MNKGDSIIGPFIVFFVVLPMALLLIFAPAIYNDIKSDQPTTQE